MQITDTMTDNNSILKPRVLVKWKFNFICCGARGFKDQFIGFKSNTQLIEINLFHGNSRPFIKDLNFQNTFLINTIIKSSSSPSPPPPSNKILNLMALN